ncbi:LPS assembly protein LptD [Pseudoalteromonas rubra]|uniref:LPS-assembly protein LptD n=1 Tax=Pseudoalteromonas rubra TaxID=43658 RepID=A0A5S3X1E0_9GAMM|nr:LPS assembly protein LptD [Pseudoalteromonas rubra]TMP38069.1 LPS-assembly protein LptD [Pseudoalteromonas rubra]
MSKAWGLFVLPLISTATFANSNIDGLQCKDYFQPKNWQPIADLPSGAIDIQSDNVELQGTDSAEFSGNVVISSNVMSLSAQAALIDKQQGLLNATGPLVFQDEYTLVNSTGMFANLKEYEFSLLGADYWLTQQNGHGSAEKLHATTNQVDLLNSSFTTCPGETPFWSIEASNIVMNRDSGWGETHNTILKILDTPIVYVPYFTFPIDDRRKSGVLTPTISSSSQRGLGVAIPYYINLAPNYDATITPRYMSKKGTQLISEFRYLTRQHQGQLAIEFLEQDDSAKQLDERYLVNWTQNSYFDENWRASVDITNVSDDAYISDLDSEYANETDTQLYRTGQLSYLGDDWAIDLKVQNFEVLGNHTESYAVLPQLTINNVTHNYQGFNWGLTGQISHFTNDELIVTDATRIHLEPSVSYDYNAYAWSFASSLGLMHTYYEQDGDDAFAQSQYKKSVSRTVPKLRLHGQLNLERQTNFILEQGTQTLEPQIQYLYTPKKDQSGIALYDTIKMQDDFFGLFREQRFSGVDFIAQANQFTLGATTRLFDSNNSERFNFSMGQILYLSDSAKPTEQTLETNALTRDNQEFGSKNYNALFAAESMLHWHRRWYFSAGLQYDADEKELIQSHMTLDYRGSNKKLVQLNHHYASDVSGYEIDQIGLFSSLPIDENWQLVASYHRDLTASRSVEVFAGLQYESCCWAVRITGKRQIQTDLNQTISRDDAIFDTSFGINFVLKGLGSKSRYDASQLLRSGIFGYRRPFFLNN